MLQHAVQALLRFSAPSTINHSSSSSSSRPHQGVTPSRPVGHVTAACLRPHLDHAGSKVGQQRAAKVAGHHLADVHDLQYKGAICTGELVWQCRRG